MCATLATSNQKKDAEIAKLRAEKEAADKKYMLKKGSGRYFSVAGGLMLALRRCLCNTAAYTAGLGFGLDVHGTTVRRWEVRLRACMLARFRDWLRTQDEACREPAIHLRQSLRIRFRQVRGDATNALVWMKCKLNVVQLHCAFVSDMVFKTTPWDTIVGNLQDGQILADLATIRGTGTPSRAS